MLWRWQPGGNGIARGRASINVTLALGPTKANAGPGPSSCHPTPVPGFIASQHPLSDWLRIASLRFDDVSGWGSSDVTRWSHTIQGVNVWPCIPMQQNNWWPRGLTCWFKAICQVLMYGITLASIVAGLHVCERRDVAAFCKVRDQGQL